MRFKLSNRFPRKLFHSSSSSSSSSSSVSTDLRCNLSVFSGDLNALRRLHSLLFTSGIASSNPFVAARLAALYSSFRRPDLSTLVLYSIPLHSRDNFLYNSVIKARFDNGDFYRSLVVHKEMLDVGAIPDGFTLPIVSSACAEMEFVEFGMCVHGLSFKLGHASVSIGSSLVYMYSKCGVLCDAVKVFEEMSDRDVVAWTAIIVGCVRNGECDMGLGWLRSMVRDEEGVRPNSRTVEGGLQACLGLEALTEGKSLHGFAMKVGVEEFVSVKSLLLSLYSRFNCLEEVVSAFYELSEKDVVSWTAIMGVYARKSMVVECSALYLDMLQSGVVPDAVFIGCMLTGFVNADFIVGGKAFHGITLRRGFDINASVINSLYSMYAKFQLLGVAEIFLDKMTVTDAESLNLMVSGYAKMGADFKCLYMFRYMQLHGFDSDLDLSSVLAVLTSCSRLETLHLGKSMHCYIIRNKIQNSVSVSNSLISMYGKCGRLDLAREVFDHELKDIITWNSLITACSHVGHSYEALCVFDQMLAEDWEPNTTTLVSVLSACSNLAALDKGKWVHNYIKELGLEDDMSLCTALVDMYAKCGQLETSREVFHAMREKDEVSWNVMISGYGIHGYAYEALELFNDMERARVYPNELTFLAALTACSHSGLLEEGRNLFSRMRKYSLTPKLNHYACMVDILARSGNLSEAEELVHSMPMEPDSGIWGSLLGASRIYNNIDMGKRIAKRAIQSDSENDGYYILMSNLYSSLGRWEDVESLRGSMKYKGMPKIAGWSSVELNQRINVFMAEDKSHPHYGEILSLLKALFGETGECHDLVTGKILVPILLSERMPSTCKAI